MGNRGRQPPTPPPSSPVMNVAPLTKAVKILIILNVAIWFVFQVVVEPFILRQPMITHGLGLVPSWVLEKFYLWQPLTYMFVHSVSPVHVLMNMLLLWWLGGELEQHWGTRFFTLYYFVSGIGAALLYILVIAIYALVTGHMGILDRPVVGASGGIFGLMTAYGIIFGDRIVYFFFMFPMRARYFVLILAGMEAVMAINNGVAGSDVANLAHIGGLLTGFVFLLFWTRIQGYRRRRETKLHGRKLKLIVDNEDGKPKYWN